MNSSLNRFNEVADLYDEVRPGYADAVIEQIAAFVPLVSQSRILEIGCGTGQITIPFAVRGHWIVGLEPGDTLATLTERKCQPYPGVKVVQSTFEDWPVEPQGFDLVLSAQAFHRIQPDFGYAKAASALKPGGAIALVWHNDISQNTDFYQATQSIYDTYFPPSNESTNAPRSKQTPYREALFRNRLFGDIQEIRHAWDKRYPGAEYLKLLNTFSDRRALPEPVRSRFFESIAEVIDRFDGVVHRKWETVALLARRHP